MHPLGAELSVRDQLLVRRSSVIGPTYGLPLSHTAHARTDGLPAAAAVPAPETTSADVAVATASTPAITFISLLPFTRPDATC